MVSLSFRIATTFLMTPDRYRSVISIHAFVTSWPMGASGMVILSPRDDDSTFAPSVIDLRHCRFEGRINSAEID